MDNQKLYLETKPLKLFMKAAVPGSISMLVSSLYMVFDSILVGKFIGTTAFAALGLAMPLVIINFALADLIGVGSSIPISISTAFVFPLIMIGILLPLKLDGLWFNYTFTAILGAILAIVIILKLKNKLFLIGEDE